MRESEPGRRLDATIALLLFLAAGAVQWFSGAYAADFAGHPDESAHFVTSVMVNRFLGQPLQDPLQFAERYYVTYPKVAIGHWPPLGYLLQALWMRVWGTGREQALLLEWFLAGIAGAVFYFLLRTGLARPLSAAGALLWLLNGAVIRSYREVMMDLPVALFCLLALLSLRAYLVLPSTGPALRFGALMGLALLTKANAILLALAPLFPVAFAGRRELLRRRDFWMMAVLPVLLAGPWHALMSFYLFRNLGGWIGTPGTVGAASFFRWSVWWEMGGVALILAALGGFGIAVMRRGPEEGLRLHALLWSSVLASCLAVNAVVRAMGEPRHLLIGLAALIALALLLADSAPRPVTAAIAVLLFFAAFRTWTPVPRWGYTDDFRTLDSGPPGNVLLSGPGDGPVIAAAVASKPDAPAQRLWLRATKLMGRVKWSGSVAEVKVRTPEEIHAMLSKDGINQVYLDPPGMGLPAPFDGALREALDGAREDWEPVSLAHPRRTARLYWRRIPVPAMPVRFELPRLGKEVGNTR